MKKFVSGLLVGILITLSITAFASGFNIIPNPYPVVVDGQKAEVTGYNINDSTFLKLTDFKLLGLDIKFNQTNKQIEINTNKSNTFDNTNTSSDTNNAADNKNSINNNSNSTTTTNTDTDKPESFKIPTITFK